MNNIKLMREKRGLTQKALADKVGVSAPYMYDLENGHRNAKPETWQRIAAVLECSVESLTGKEEDLLKQGQQAEKEKEAQKCRS